MQVEDQNLDFVSEQIKVPWSNVGWIPIYPKGINSENRPSKQRLLVSALSNGRLVSYWQECIESYVIPMSHYCSTTDMERSKTELTDLSWNKQQLLDTCVGCPPSKDMQLQTLSFWHYILQKGEHRISRRVFLECKKIAKEEHIRNWAYEVRCILAECHFLPWWQNNSCGNGQNHSKFRSERDKWKKEVIAKTKLRT